MSWKRYVRCRCTRKKCGISVYVNFLESVGVRVGDVKIAVRIERYPEESVAANAGESPEISSRGIKPLDCVAEKVGHIKDTASVERKAISAVSGSGGGGEQTWSPPRIEFLDSITEVVGYV